MGLSESVLWLSWTLTYTIMFFITSLCVTLVLCGSTVYPKSDFGLIFILFFFFSLSVIAYCHFVQVFFSRATVAATVCAH